MGVLALFAFDHQLLGVVQQRFRLGHGFDGLLHFGVLLDGGRCCGIFLAEGGDVHFPLQLVLDPGAIRGEFGFGELGASFLSR